MATQLIASLTGIQAMLSIRFAGRSPNRLHSRLRVECWSCRKTADKHSPAFIA